MVRFPAIDTAKNQLHVEPVLSSKDLINPEVDHIGVMAHAAWLEASTRSKIDMIEEEPEPEPELERHVTVVDLSEPSSPNDPPVTVKLKSDWRIDHLMTFEVWNRSGVSKV